jgi:hypothetical protein
LYGGNSALAGKPLEETGREESLEGGVPYKSIYDL